MFTDVEIGLMMRHQREMKGLTSDAQTLVDRKDRQIAKLHRALESAWLVNSSLLADVGRSRIDDILVVRALKARSKAH